MVLPLALPLLNGHHLHHELAHCQVLCSPWFSATTSSHCLFGLTADATGRRFVKLWSFSELSEADSGEDSQYFFLRPLDQLHLGVGFRVRSLLWQAQGRWLVGDEAGSIMQASILHGD